MLGVGHLHVVAAPQRPDLELPGVCERGQDSKVSRVQLGGWVSDKSSMCEARNQSGKFCKKWKKPQGGLSVPGLSPLLVLRHQE